MGDIFMLFMQTISLVGDAQTSAGQHGKALASYERSLNVLQELGQDQGSVAAIVQKKLVHAYLSRGKFEQALQAVEKMLPYARNVHITEHSTAMHCLENVVDALASKGEAYKAIEAATVLYQVSPAFIT
jgi:tetratricopeptide (TPR) repeat protein